MDADKAATDRRTGTREILWALSVATVVGIGLFAYLAWRSVSVERAAPNDALKQFEEVRNHVHGEPVVQVGADGTLTRRPPQTDRASPSLCCVLAYRVPEQRLVRTAVPFWFLKVKGPAVQYALRDTGRDLTRLQVTPADLEQYGPTVVFDETRQTVIGYWSGRSKTLPIPS